MCRKFQRHSAAEAVPYERKTLRPETVRKREDVRRIVRNGIGRLRFRALSEARAVRKHAAELSFQPFRAKIKGGGVTAPAVQKDHRIAFILTENYAVHAPPGRAT